MAATTGIVSAVLALVPYNEEAAWAVIALLFVGGIIGSGFLMVRAWQHFLQGLRLKQTCNRGYVRRFEGPLGWFDPTDASLHTLYDAGLLQFERGAVNSVELLANRDVAYSVNGVFQESPLRLGVTTATRQPTKSTLWSVPKSWLEEGTPGQAKRRRPSAEELEELAEYGSLSRKFWLQSVLRVVLFTPFIAYGISIVYLSIAQELEEILHLTYDPSQVFFRVIVSALLAALAIVGAHVFRRIRLRQRIAQELELGWIIVASALACPQRAPPGTISGPVVEYFPLTYLLWTIDGKPAGWRRHAKRKGISAPAN